MHVIKDATVNGILQRSTDYVTAPSIAAEFPERLELTHPVDAVFIGISNYDRHIVPTPSHPISASIMQRLFENAAARAKLGASSKFEFHGDLRLDPLDPAWGMREVSSYLHTLGHRGLYDFSPVFSHKRGELWPLIQGKPLRRAVLLDIVSRHADRLATAGSAQRPRGVLYIAAHGILGSDGRSYVLAADSDGDQMENLIGYQEILEIYKKRLGSDMALRIMVMIDTCLAPNDVEVAPADKDIDVGPGVLLLSATAPGQYSNYWNQSAGLTINSMSVGIGPFRRKAKNVDLTYYRTISIVPIALVKLMRYIEDSCSKQPHSQPRYVRMNEIAAAVRDALPELAEADEIAPGRRQTALVYLDSIHRTMDSYLEMAVTAEQRLAIHRASSLFTTNCL